MGLRGVRVEHIPADPEPLLGLGGSLYLGHLRQRLLACEQPTHLLVHLVPVWYAVVRLGGVKKRGRIGAHYTASVSSFPSQP